MTVRKHVASSKKGNRGARQKQPSPAELMAQIERLTKLLAQTSTNRGPAPITLNAYLPRWRARVYPIIVANTKASYEAHLNQMILPQLGELLLEHIDEDAIVTWRNTLRAKGYASSTVASALKTLKSILRTAVKAKLLAGMPEVSNSHVRKEQPWLTAEEYAQVVRCAEGISDMMLALVLLAGDAGLRRGEAIGLKFSHIIDGVIDLREQKTRYGVGALKNKKPRLIPMTLGLAAVVSRLRAEAKSDDSYVLLNQHGKPLSYFSVIDRIHRLCRLAGIKKKVKYHSLRHTFISNLGGKGVPLPVVQQLVGHAAMSTTQLYMHTEEDQLHVAIEKLRR